MTLSPLRLCLLSLLLAMPAAAGTLDPEALTRLTLEQAREQARAAHKALVLNIGASWCGPCKVLISQVMPDTRVRQALGEVVYAHYDAEAGPGIAAARALGVHGFPTLVALAQDGGEISRITGVPSIEGLAQWLGRVAAESDPVAVLEARVRKDPGDGRSWLVLARRYKKRGEPERAQKALEQALEGARGKDEAVAAAADWALRMARLQALFREAPRQVLAEHLARYPDGPMADTALQALARLGPVDADTQRALGQYIEALIHRAEAAGAKDGAVPYQEALNQAVYACLRAGAYDAAERGARWLVAQDGRSALYLDTLAEVRHLRGDSAAAIKLEGQALAVLDAMKGAERDARPVQQLRAELSRNQARYRRGHREPPAEFAQQDDEPFPWEQ